MTGHTTHAYIFDLLCLLRRKRDARWLITAVVSECGLAPHIRMVTPMRASIQLSVAVMAMWLASFSAGAQAPAALRPASVCELSGRPDDWNHVRVRVTGVATHESERFTLSDPACPASQSAASIWLTYGGRASAETAFCCPGEGARGRRQRPLVIDGIALPLVEDASFLRFRERLRNRDRITARVTVVGTFFAGKQSESIAPGSRGYGHFGCCTLLVIEQIQELEAATAPSSVSVTDE